jgi:hypothetical protein
LERNDRSVDKIIWIVTSTLACIGIAVMAGDFLFVRRSRKLTRSNYRLITLYDDPIQVERLLNQCLLRLGWQGPEGAIILVDMGMGEQSLAACTRAMKEMHGAFLCRAEELPQTLRHLDALMEGEGQGLPEK